MQNQDKKSNKKHQNSNTKKDPNKSDKKTNVKFEKINMARSI